MIQNESEQEWAERVEAPAAAVALVLLVGIFCYVFLMPLIFGFQPDLHAAVR